MAISFLSIFSSMLIFLTQNTAVHLSTRNDDGKKNWKIIMDLFFHSRFACVPKFCACSVCLDSIHYFHCQQYEEMNFVSMSDLMVFV